MALDYQAQWFDGLIHEPCEGGNKPALGLVWTNLISSRIMLVRDLAGTTIKVVFSPFARPASLRYAIGSGVGIYAVKVPVDPAAENGRAVAITDGIDSGGEDKLDEIDFVDYSDVDVADLSSSQHAEL